MTAAESPWPKLPEFVESEHRRWWVQCSCGSGTLFYNSTLEAIEAWVQHVRQDDMACGMKYPRPELVDRFEGRISRDHRRPRP